MNEAQLASVAQSLVADGRGILAADESTGTITRRFKAIGIESTEENRRDYREVLFTTAELGKYISGAILYDETIRQSAADGQPLTKVLTDQNIHPGIKVDTGAKPLAGADGETVTEGLDGLADRVAEYVSLGATFAKWRAVITIGRHLPSAYCVHVNAHALARYARLCQEGGLVPIVEPEVLMDGAHDIDRCERVTEDTLDAVFDELHRQRVALEGMLLKPNMVISGTEAADRAGVEEVAERTVRCLRRKAPAAVPGVVFLSGGQTEVEATAHLNAMNANYGPNPWKLSFSYGRALQDGALKGWRGEAGNTGAAQSTLQRRALLNSAAALGAYSGEAA